MKQSVLAVLVLLLGSGAVALAQWRDDAVVPEAGKEYAVVALSANVMREEPAFEAEMGDQALMGSVVEILARKGSWVQIRTGEPYTAWVTELGLVPMDHGQLKDYIAAPKLICTAAVTRVFEQPFGKAASGSVVCELVAGDLLRWAEATPKELLRPRKGFVPVMLPTGKTGWVRAGEVMPFDAWASAYGASAPAAAPSAEAVLATARRFLGVPYLWGGTSIKNVDCSGLSRSVFFLCGLLLPRNASQQAFCGTPVEPAGPLAPWAGSADGAAGAADDAVSAADAGSAVSAATAVPFWASLQPGDLVFWGREATAEKPARATHVGIYLGDGRFIHASHLVRINSFDPSQSDFYDRKPLCFRRILGTQDSPGSGVLSVSNSPYYFPQP